ncbi:MAG: FTR1 family iron permease, partial [Chloroflexota bacterium]
NPILDENSTVGGMLKALLGYNGNPALTEVIAYVAYLGTVLLALRWTDRNSATAPAQAPA